MPEYCRFCLSSKCNFENDSKKCFECPDVDEVQFISNMTVKKCF